jgi:hypothetical protein
MANTQYKENPVLKNHEQFGIYCLSSSYNVNLQAVTGKFPFKFIH